MSVPARGQVDRLGVLLATFAAAALAFLPFVVFKANRIVPGDPRDLLEVLALPPALATIAAVAIAAFAAIRIANPSFEHVKKSKSGEFPPSATKSGKVPEGRMGCGEQVRHPRAC